MDIPYIFPKYGPYIFPKYVPYIFPCVFLFHGVNRRQVLIAKPAKCGFNNQVIRMGPYWPEMSPPKKLWTKFALPALSNNLKIRKTTSLLSLCGPSLVSLDLGPPGAVLFVTH